MEDMPLEFVLKLVQEEVEVPSFRIEDHSDQHEEDLKVDILC